MPLQATSGAASYDGFGGGVPVAANYIEDVFSTWLFTGNGGTQTITNGIDLSTYGGMIWGKQRLPSNQAAWHEIVDTARGFGSTRRLSSNATNAGMTGDVTGVTTSGFTLGNVSGNLNTQDWQSVSWTFRKQPKFFDVVTYTGDGNPQNISHNLGSTPGLIIVKGVSGDFSTGNWAVYHRSLTETTAIQLNNSNAAFTTSSYWNNTAPTSTQFTVGTAAQTGAPNTTYVAYLFAHNAGGFGLTGTDNVISCGSVVSTGGNINVSLGYEPQWIMIKNASNIDGWYMFDIMREMSLTNDAFFRANLSDAEGSFFASYINPTATGFRWNSGAFGAAGETYIYIAIRRGPMKTPTSGTSVFAPVTQTGNTTITTNFPVDTVIDGIRNSASGSSTTDRLRGSSTNFFNVLNTYSTSAETSGSGAGFGFDNNTGYAINGIYGGTTQTVMWNFRRAPGFFDVVCFTAGTSTNRRVDHNLTTPPQLILLKARNVAQSWYAYSETLGINGILYPNQNWAPGTVTNAWGSSAPTATNFGINEPTFASAGDTYVAYLFATVSGVSKVGSYTGTGTTLQIDCGFTGGARFVLIKRTDSTGDWYVWDSARGIVSGNDPYLLLNSTAAEVTNTDYVDTYSAGFEISSTAPAAINANGGSFIFLAIA